MEDVIKNQLCNFCTNKNENKCLCYIEIQEKRTVTKKCLNYKLDKNINIEKYIEL